MPLQATITFDNGITLQEGYVVINNVCITYLNPSHVDISVLIYKDATAYNDEKSEVIALKHLCTSTSFETYFSESVLGEAFKTPLTQSYAFLQTLPLYGGAIIV